MWFAVLLQVVCGIIGADFSLLHHQIPAEYLPIAS